MNALAGYLGRPREARPDLPRPNVARPGSVRPTDSGRPAAGGMPKLGLPLAGPAREAVNRSVKGVKGLRNGH